MRLLRLVSVLIAIALSANAAVGAESAAEAFSASDSARGGGGLFHPGALAILPDDGRGIYLEAFAAARGEIRIEICVLEDPQILQGLRSAIDRGVRVRVIVDSGKYAALQDERDNLATYVTGAGAQLHLSNPIFPRSFPKVILIDGRYVVVGSACLDTTTFTQYRDYAYVSDAPGIIKDLSRLFENDWRHSTIPGQAAPTYNPTPVIRESTLLVSPVNAAYRLVTLYQTARRTLDVTSELLGDPTLESELAGAVARGVRVRLIAPEIVNGGTTEVQDLQIASLTALKAAGIEVHVTHLPESATTPYMHARTAVIDGDVAYLGSISLSPDSSTYDRNVGLILEQRRVVNELRRQFAVDFKSNSQPY